MNKASEKEVLSILEKLKNFGSEAINNSIVSIKEKNIILYSNFHRDLSKISKNDISVSNIKDIEEIKKINPMILSHLVIYKKIKKARIVVQPDLMWCNIWSMTGEKLPKISYLHATNSQKDIPCTNDVLDYDTDFSTAIAETVYKTISKCEENELGLFIKHYGSIIWGVDSKEVFKKTTIIEKLAKEAYFIKVAMNGQYKYMPFQLSEELFKYNNEV